VPAYAFVLFDLDGTLVDSFADIAAAAERALADVGGRADDALLALCRRGLPLEELYTAAFGAAHDDPAHDARYRRFFDAYRAHYLPSCLERTRPYEGVEDTLASICVRPDAPRTAVATTKRRDTAVRILEGTGLARFIDVVAGCDGIPAKPDPAVLRRAADMAGLGLGAGALMVGDTDRDVGAARAAGCAAAAVTYGGMSRDELAQYAPDHLIGRFAELAEIV
jgi:phosphoglycolate phosphatase